MKIGFIGLGKLGLPVALATERRGHEVFGCDVNPDVVKAIQDRKLPYQEVWADAWLEETRLEVLPLDEVVRRADLVFVPIQTPHQYKFEGVTELPHRRADFDYSWLKQGVQDVVSAAERHQKETTLAVISTVLPGTMEREIQPVLNHWTHLIYNPFFIAMGTTAEDFLHPEFVLMGVEEQEPALLLEKFYASIHDRPVFRTDIRTAELIKVAYNTLIGQKIIFINTMMEICHKTGADVDDLSDALALATDRVISPKYLRGGMGDGGGCHPRDHIAMSWLARELNLSHDLFEDVMLTREDQTDWLASLIEKEAEKRDLPVVLLGKAYKADTNLTVGSPALLLARLLQNRGVEFEHFDHRVEDPLPPGIPAIYFIATNHMEYAEWTWAKGSVVLDPWGYIPSQEGVEVVRIGRQH